MGWVEDKVPEDVRESSLLKFTVTLDNGTSIPIDLLDDISLEFDDIEDQLQRVSAQYMFFAAVYSELKSSVNVQERKLKSIRGHATMDTLDEARRRGIKLTDKQLGMAVEADQNLQKEELRHIILQKHTGKLYNMVEAMKMKLESLRSLAGFKKKEYDVSREQT